MVGLAKVGTGDMRTGQFYDDNGRPTKARITHVNIDKEIRFERHHGEIVEYCKVEIEIAPRPKFYSAMQLLLGVAIEECCLGKEWQGANVLSLTLEYLTADDRQYKIKKIEVALPRQSKSPVIVPVPAIGMDFISDSLDKAVWEIVAEARKFIAGESAQGNLFSGGDSPDTITVALDEEGGFDQ